MGRSRKWTCGAFTAGGVARLADHRARPCRLSIPEDAVISRSISVALLVTVAALAAVNTAHAAQLLPPEPPPSPTCGACQGPPPVPVPTAPAAILPKAQE